MSLFVNGLGLGDGTDVAGQHHLQGQDALPVGEREGDALVARRRQMVRARLRNGILKAYLHAGDRQIPLARAAAPVAVATPFAPAPAPTGIYRTYWAKVEY